MSDILFLVIENYIKTGQPVGSKKVHECMENPPSAATIRNEMANLTVLGLLEQPHVSSGRVPSLNGYRFYVNYLIQNKKLDDYEKNYIYGMFDDISYDPESIIKESCKVLSNITNTTVISTAPPIGDSFVEEIKFVQVGLRTVILILISSSGMIQNQIFNCEFEINDGILEMFKKAVNSELKGKKIKSLVMHKIIVDKDIIIVPAFEAAFKAVKKACDINVVVKGQKFLFDFYDHYSAFSILDLIEKKEFNDFLFSSSNDMKIYIGNDCGIDILSKCCIIVEKYNVGTNQGVIASIGSINMNYSDVISKMKLIKNIIQELFIKIMSL